MSLFETVWKSIKLTRTPASHRITAPITSDYRVFVHKPGQQSGRSCDVLYLIPNAHLTDAMFATGLDIGDNFSDTTIPGSKIISLDGGKLDDGSVGAAELDVNATGQIYYDRTSSDLSLTSVYSTIADVDVVVSAADTPCEILIMASGDAYGTTNSSSAGYVEIELRVDTSQKQTRYAFYLAGGGSGISIGGGFSFSYRYVIVGSGTYNCNIRGRRLGALSSATVREDADITALLMKRW